MALRQGPDLSAAIPSAHKLERRRRWAKATLPAQAQIGAARSHKEGGTAAASAATSATRAAADTAVAAAAVAAAAGYAAGHAAATAFAAAAAAAAA
eukprot:CAMPEP_0177546750 /NCGR_PEP_ID=MMETSP0369-20130122/63403_1 /TAXON_ID=447022 ORGANISM="Scrippsiella hangoei-like, Strain SHHI-4" /NCGR_SAMPLE_ID=MMETSP0369 /ASSEMBLY_ACC=CAM_ASM_000364 /LENGTH=95 /DNA_ID=CAMNT_0019031301 /DNA_START=67 /DNA_END=350 /DNA_ORIENTATION=-